jgi:hypothetical protein
MCPICAGSETPANRGVRARRAPADTVDLADGSVGYFMRPRRTDDCWQAAVATVLQVPIDEVPDSRLRERRRGGEHPAEIVRSARREMDAWLVDRGLRMVTHRKVPVARARWIGIVPFPYWFMSHSLVMNWDRVVFDPSERSLLASAALFEKLGLSPPAGVRGVRVRTWGPEEVGYGFSFVPTTGAS